VNQPTSLNNSDPLIQEGTNNNGVNFAIYMDRAIGDHYLIINDRSRPVFTGSKAQCLTMAKGWAE
tara:strand:- start:2646 stop:2840 length:195 start_codon:yes stop_codon:yes gene_type:complete